MDVLLVGGPDSLDGIRRDVKDPYNHRALQFRVPSDFISSVCRDKDLMELTAETHLYLIEPIQCNKKEWWIGIHTSMTIEEALGRIIDRYP